MRTRGAGPRSQLGTLLIERGLIDEAGLERALALQSRLGQRLGTNLLELGLVTESDLLDSLSSLRHTQVVTADELRAIPAEIIRLVPSKLARRYRIVPVKRSGGTLLIGSLDPGEALIEDEIGSLTSRLTRTVMGIEARIHEALERYYHVPAPERFKALAQRLDHGGGLAMPGQEDTPVVPPAEPAAQTATPESTMPAAAAKRRQPKVAPPPRPMFIELPEEERALIYGKRREEALSRERRDPIEATDAGPESVAPDDNASSNEPAPIDVGAAASVPSRGGAERPTLAHVSAALQRVDIRDEIADQVLAFTQGLFRRRLLLMCRKDRILGWRGEGEGITDRMVRALDMPLDEASVFKSLIAGLERWRGPLPPFHAHETLVAGLGGTPEACIVLPIRLRERVVSFFYGDNGDASLDESSLDDVTLDELQRLVQKAGVALEVIILKNKIRVL